MVSGVGWQGGDGEGGGAGSGAEGKKGVTQGRNKKELENKKKGGGKQAGALLVLLAPCCGASTVPSPSPPPASEEFGVSRQLRPLRAQSQITFVLKLDRILSLHYLSVFTLLFMLLIPLEYNSQRSI